MFGQGAEASSALRTFAPGTTTLGEFKGQERGGVAERADWQIQLVPRELRAAEMADIQ